MQAMHRVTMAQVARQAGVSRSAVSAAFSDRDSTAGLNPATRAQIRKIASELGYQPNILSRSFIKQQSFLVGMIGNETFFLFALEMTKGIEEIIGKTPYSLLTYYHGSLAEDQTKHMQKCLSRRVDAIIIAGAAEAPDGPNHRLIQRLHEQGLPLVQIYRKIFPNVPSVISDDRRAGYLTARHLIDLGHRKIAHVTMKGYHDEGAPGADREVEWRAEGYLQAITEAGLEPHMFTFDRAAYYPGRNDYHDYFRQVAPQLVAEKFTGVTTYNDYSALALIQVLSEMGVPVPQQMSITGYDNHEGGNWVRPRLTTVQPRFFDIGRETGRMIMESMQNQKVSDVVLPPELLLRESTMPPPK